MNRKLAIVLALLVLGLGGLHGGSVASAQDPDGVRNERPFESVPYQRAPTACPPSVEFGCLVSGTGAWGWRVDNFATTNGAFALYGRIRSNTPGANSAAVRGENLGTNGNGYGVLGSHEGSGVGVYGYSNNGIGFRGYSNTSIGMYGSTTGTGTQPGVLGIHTATTGTGAGVEGRTNSTSVDAAGVLGVANAANAAGVRGINPSGAGVIGNSTSSTGVHGGSTSGSGVTGATNSSIAAGVYGTNASGRGVWGYTPSSSYGVYGQADGLGGHGVYGRADLGTNVISSIGVHGVTVSGVGVRGDAGSEGIAIVGYGGTHAGYFVGNVHVQGTLSKSGGSFRIDHPLDPDNQYLSHSFVESPDMMNVYNGNITTDANGDATVELPAYFEALNRDYRYQLTVIGQFAQAIISEKVHNNRFSIKTDLANVEVSWQVTGIRQDAWANENRIPVEEPKPEEERGTYLYPEGFGQPEERGVNYEERQDMEQMQADAPPAP